MKFIAYDFLQMLGNFSTVVDCTKFGVCEAWSVRMMFAKEFCNLIKFIVWDFLEMLDKFEYCDGL